MTNKQIKCELYNYNVYNAQIKNIDLEIERIKHDYQGIKGQGFEDVGGGGTNAITRSVENEVIQKDAKIARLVKERESISMTIQKIDNALMTLTELERKVIEERYFKNQDFYMVADVLGYSYQWARQKDRDAISKLEMSMY